MQGLFLFFRKIIQAIISKFSIWWTKTRNKKKDVSGHLVNPNNLKKYMMIAGLAGIFIFGLLIYFNRSQKLISTHKLETEHNVGLTSDVINESVEFKAGEVVQIKTPKMVISCETIKGYLRQRGTLTNEEYQAFLEGCKDSFGETYEAIKKLMNPANKFSDSTVSDIANKMLDNPSDANKISELLNDKKIKDALASDARDDILSALPALSKMEKDDAQKTVEALQKAPQENRANILQVAEKASQTKDKKTKDALFKALGDANGENLGSLVKLANSLDNLNDDEKRKMAESYNRATSPEAKQALADMAVDIGSLDPQDKTRTKLVNLAEEASKLSGDDQKKSLQNLAKLTNDYSNASPEERQIMGQMIQDLKADDLKNKEKIENIKNLAEAITDFEKEGIKIPNAMLKKAMKGDNEATDRILAAKKANDDANNTSNEAEREFNKNKVYDILSGNTPYSDIKDQKMENQMAKDNNLDNQSTDDLKNNMKNNENKINDLTDQKNKLSEEYKKLTLSGVDFDSPEMRDIRSKQEKISDELKRRESLYNASEVALRKKLRNLTEQLKKETKGMNIEIPDLENSIETRKSENNYIPVYANIDQNPNLLQSNMDYNGLNKTTKTREIAFFKTSDDLNSDKARNGAKKIWRFAGNNMTQGQVGDEQKGFSMSYGLRIPVVLNRVPVNGIARSKVGETSLEAIILAPIYDRKTKKLAIPAMSRAYCKGTGIDVQLKKLYVKCQLVEVGSEDLDVKFVLGGPDGEDGLPGKIYDDKGWYYGGIFLTAFVDSIFQMADGLLLGPILQKSSLAAQDYVYTGVGKGTATAGQQLTTELIEDMKRREIYWFGVSTMIGSIRQE